MTSFFSEQWIQALGWTLLHSLWQIGLAALLLYAVLSCSRNSSAHFRYGAATLTLLCSAVLVILTFAYMLWQYEPAATASHRQSILASAYYLTAVPDNEFSPPSATAPVLKLQTLKMLVEEHAATLVVLWIMGVLLLTLRFLGGLLYTARLKNHPSHRVHAYWQERTQQLALRMGIHSRLSVMASVVTRVPVVIGQLKPVVLLPAALLAQLPAEQMEAVIAHELAHIYRKDYWVNLLQSVAEIVFFYHPALWWISAVIRQERENCCDDMAVSLCGSAVTFAKALAQVETTRQQMGELALAASGSGNHLLHRIERLLQPTQRKKQTYHPFASLLLVLLLLTASAMAFRTYENPLRHSRDSLMDQPRINFNDPSGAKAAAAAMQDFLSSAQPQKAAEPRSAARTEPCPQASAGLPCEQAMTASLAKAIADTLDPAAALEEEMLLDMNMDMLWDGHGEAWDSLHVFGEDSLRPDFSYAFSSDAAPFVFDLDMEDPASIVMHHAWTFPHLAGDTLPPHPFLADSLHHLIMPRIDSAMQHFHLRLQDSLLHGQIADAMLQAETELRRLHDFWQDSARIHELTEKALEAQRRALERQAEVLRRKAEAMEKRAQRLEERAREKARSKRSSFDNAIQQLEAALLQDGLIQQGKKYSFEIKENQLRINGKKQPKRLYEKYASMLSESMQMNLEEGGNFSLSKTPDE